MKKKGADGRATTTLSANYCLFLQLSSVKHP
jgi:hypothetical protein